MQCRNNPEVKCHGLLRYKKTIYYYLQFYKCTNQKCKGNRGQRLWNRDLAGILNFRHTLHNWRNILEYLSMFVVEILISSPITFKFNLKNSKKANENLHILDILDWLFFSSINRLYKPWRKQITNQH